MSTELLENPTTKQIAFSIADEKIAEWRSMYMPLRVDGIDDTKGLKVIHNARMTVKNARVDIEKKRVELKADALKFGKLVDGEAKRLTALLEPIEEHLEAEERRVEEEKKRIKEEAERKLHEATMARMNALLAVGCDSFYYAQVAVLTEEQFTATLASATEAHRIEQDRIATEKAEQDRLAEIERQRIEAEKKEQARLRAEEDAKRKAEAEQLAKERAELERQQAEHRAELAKQQAEHDRIAAEQRAEAAKLAAERQAIEKAENDRKLAEAEAKARQEAQEKARIEAEQKAEREAEEARKREADASAIRAKAKKKHAKFIAGLPTDVAEAIEHLGTVVKRHAAIEWSEISRTEMVEAIDLVRDVVLEM